MIWRWWRSGRRPLFLFFYCKIGLLLLFYFTWKIIDYFSRIGTGQSSHLIYVPVLLLFIVVFLLYLVASQIVELRWRCIFLSNLIPTSFLLDYWHLGYLSRTYCTNYIDFVWRRTGLGADASKFWMDWYDFIGSYCLFALQGERLLMKKFELIRFIAVSMEEEDGFCSWIVDSNNFRCLNNLKNTSFMSIFSLRTKHRRWNFFWGVILLYL